MDENYCNLTVFDISYDEFKDLCVEAGTIKPMFIFILSDLQRKAQESTVFLTKAKNYIYKVYQKQTFLKISNRKISSVIKKGDLGELEQIAGLMSKVKNIITG